MRCRCTPSSAPPQRRRHGIARAGIDADRCRPGPARAGRCARTPGRSVAAPKCCSGAQRFAPPRSRRVGEGRQWPADANSGRAAPGASFASTARQAMDLMYRAGGTPEQRTHQLLPLARPARGRGGQRRPDWYPWSARSRPGSAHGFVAWPSSLLGLGYTRPASRTVQGRRIQGCLWSRWR